MSDANFLALAERFWSRLEACVPASVLDVGCGGGFLIGRCQEREIRAVGLDPSRSRLIEVAAVGFPVARAAAVPLPVRTGGADWVTLGQVLHHVSDVAAALREAVRVARRGVLVAEPWYDLAWPAQRLAARADAWLKRQQARAGHPVRPPLDPAEVVAALPAARVASWEVERWWRPWPLPPAHFAEKAAKFLATLPPDAPDRFEYDALREAIARDGWQDCGTAIVTVRLRPAGRA